MGDPAAASRASGRRGNGALRFLRDLLVILLAAVLVAFLVKTYLFRSFYIPSGSMLNTLQINDRVIVDELVPHRIALHRGDVVVFQDPDHWLANEPAAVAPVRTPFASAVHHVLDVVGLGGDDPDNHLIKRVIGLPGDHVSCCDAAGHLMVNGVALHEPYITLTSGTAEAAPEHFSVVVPAGHLWVMGDNRDQSADSLYHHVRHDPGDGFVPVSDVTGRAIIVSWPVGRWRWLGD